MTSRFSSALLGAFLFLVIPFTASADDGRGDRLSTESVVSQLMAMEEVKGTRLFGKVKPFTWQLSAGSNVMGGNLPSGKPWSSVQTTWSVKDGLLKLKLQGLSKTFYFAFFREADGTVFGYTYKGGKISKSKFLRIDNMGKDAMQLAIAADE